MATLFLKWLSGETLTANVYPYFGGAVLNAVAISCVADPDTPNLYSITTDSDEVEAQQVLVDVRDAGGSLGMWEAIILDAENGEYMLAESTVAVSLSGVPPIAVTISTPIAQAALEPNTISIMRGDSVRVQLPLLGNISARKKLELTVKPEKQVQKNTDTSTFAILHITELGGLDRLNGSSAGLTSSDADLDVIDEVTGEVYLVLKPRISSVINHVDRYSYDAQWISSADEISTPTIGDFVVTADVSQAIA